MKIILEFTEEEKSEALRAMRVYDYVGALQEFDNWLRGTIKHTEDDMIEVASVRERLWECLDGTDIWD